MPRPPFIFKIAAISLLASSAQSADSPTAKPQEAIPPTPEAVTAIERDLPSYRNVTSQRKKISTDIGEVTKLSCWFNAAGAVRKIVFTQNADFEHVWYWTGAAGKEQPVFAIENGAARNAAGRRAKYVVRSWFGGNGKLTVSHMRGDDESEDLKRSGPLFEAEVDLKDLQKSVALLLAEPLRQPAK